MMREHTHETPEPGHGPSPAPGAGRDTDAVLQSFAKVLIETAPDAIILADSRGTIMLWNKAAQHLFGYSEEEVMGQPLTSLMPARYRDAHLKGLKRVQSSGHSRLAGKAIDLHGLRKDGTEFPLELSLGTWQSGDSMFFSGIIRDTTERKRSEEALRESQERYRQLVEQARDIIYRTDAQGRFTFVNPTTSLIMGYSEQELLGRRFVELIRPDAREAAERFYSLQFMRRTPSTYYEFPAITRDGQEVWFGQNVQVLLDNDHVVGFHAVTRDITERKQAEQALQQAYDETEKILASVPGAILAADQDLRVVYANALACQYFSEGRELLGAPLNDVLPADVTQRCWVYMRRTPQTAENGYWQQDRQFERHGKVYEYRFFPLAIRGSERPQIGIVLWDITENKRLADQIIQAEKLAGLGTLVAGMAHEVNNPAQGIMGLAQLMQDEADLTVVRDYARDIVGYTKHIATVVRDFTNYARQSDQDDEMELDLADRMAEAVKLLRRSPHFGHVEVATDFHPVPFLKARQTEIDQVFVNLIGNAVQAMDGRGCLTLATALRDNTFTASVRDTGSGIPKDRLAKLFDPFYTTKEPGKGTGLGLYIVHKIVTKYGGRIQIGSKVGKGTTFTVAFPLGHTSPQGGQS